jgi:hypothetical protein
MDAPRTIASLPPEVAQTDALHVVRAIQGAPPSGRLPDLETSEIFVGLRRVLGDKVTISLVSFGSEAAKYGLAPGDEIKAVLYRHTGQAAIGLPFPPCCC